MENNEKRSRAACPPDLDFGHTNTKPRTIQAEAGRLTLHPVAAPPADVQHPRGIFLRGVASHPVTVSQHPPVPDANARAGTGGFDQLRFLGVSEEARQQQAPPSQQLAYPSTLATSDQPLPQASMRTTPSDIQLPPLRTLDTDALAPRYRETADQSYSWREGRTTPPHEAVGYAGFPSYAGVGRGESALPSVTVTPETTPESYWGSAYPTAARQSHVMDYQRQQQQYQQFNTQQVHSPYYPPPPVPTNDYAAYPYASWASTAYPAETTQPRESGTADRAVSADPRRYDDSRSWDRPYSAPPPLGRETSHLLNAMRGEPTTTRPRPVPAQWSVAADVQGSQGSPPRDPRRQWTPVGPETSQPVAAATAEWPEPITVPGSTPTWDPSPTSSHFQVPYTPQPYATPLFSAPTATSGMPPMIEKQLPPIDMYHTTATPFY